MAFDQNGNFIDAFQFGTNQEIAASAVSIAVANAFGGQTKAVRITTLADVRVAFGTAPTATSSSPLIKATDPPEVVAVVPGDKVAAITNASATTTVSVTELK